MRILVTNDDGIYSPGLRALAEVASGFGTTRIVAPDLEQSSTAHAITASRPLTMRKTKVASFEAFRVNGTPADCVGLGMHVWGHVDLVFSGINLGHNLGNSMWHSGTLAGAKQACLLGARGIAFSAPEMESEEGYYGIRPHLERVVEELLALEELRLVNVNLPARPKGVRYARQSVRQYDGRIVPDEDPQGRQIYWFSPRPLDPPDIGTDRWAIEHDLISITPLRLDLTDHRALEHMLGKMDKSA